MLELDRRGDAELRFENTWKILLEDEELAEGAGAEDEQFSEEDDAASAECKEF